LSNAGTYNETVLQRAHIDFNTRPQNMGKIVTLHQSKPLWIMKTNFPGLQTCNQFSILDLCRKTGCTFVDWGSSLSGHVTRNGLLWCGMPILQVFCGLFSKSTCRLQNFGDTCSVDCKD